jgi:large subunit ribosomal protein L22
VKQAVANDGPRLKRIRPAPMGRAFRYQRRISHLELVLAEKVSSNGHGGAAGTTADTKPAKKTVKKAPVKKAAAKKAPAKKAAAKKATKK